LPAQVYAEPIELYAGQAFSADTLEQELQRLETLLHESRDETWDRSRDRWRRASPDAELTWSRELTGNAFVEKVAAPGGFGPEKKIVEIGPGYGRLLSACSDLQYEFGSWLGVDLSATNVAFLSDRFAEDARISFVEADVEAVQLPVAADTIVSSLTFKHLFPSFERALTNLAAQMVAGGRAIFDLIEGERRYFEPDGVTYIRWYSRPEIEEIAGRAGLEVESFDEVEHAPGWTRLLVVARTPE
jgi:SAM-dependent methyltransferase